MAHAQAHTQFCPQCGVKLMAGAKFCAECGAAAPGAKGPRLGALPLQRYAPLLVLVAVVGVAGGAVMIGLSHPKTPPKVPQHQGGTQPGAAQMPPGHPPIDIPEDVKQTIRDMAKAAEAQPDNLQAWKQLAEIQYRAGQVDAGYLAEAQLSYEHVLEHEPENAEVLQSLGNIAFDRDQSDKAIDYYTRYLKLKPDDLNVRTDLATMRLAAGQTEQAIKAYQEILATNPSWFQAQFNLGVAYGRSGQTAEAVAALQKARGLAADDRTRKQVDQVLASVQSGGAAPGAAAAGGTAETFRAGIEEFFRSNQVLGPKLDRFEWTGDTAVRVMLHEFPFAAMPEDVTKRFTDRIHTQIKEQKAAHRITQPVQVQLVDSATGEMMETVSE